MYPSGHYYDHSYSTSDWEDENHPPKKETVLSMYPSKKWLFFLKEKICLDFPEIAHASEI